MKHFHLLAFVITSALATTVSTSRADVLSTYGDAVVMNSVNGPVWQLTSDLSGIGYAGLELQITSAGFTPADLTMLSAMYQMTEGNFGGGSPRFTLFDNSFNSAWIYWGSPPSYNSDPNGGVWGSTGNLLATALVYSNDFGGFNSPNTGVSYADFITDVGATDISYITLDVDGGWIAPQQLITNAFTVNDTVYNPSLPVPEPSVLAVVGAALLAMFGLAALRRRSA